MDLERVVEILRAIDIGLVEPAVGVAVPLHHAAPCGDCGLGRPQCAVHSPGQQGIGMLRTLHFDRAFAQTSKVTHTVRVDIVAFDLAGPRNTFKSWRWIESTVLAAAFAQRPGSRIAGMVVVLRSRLRIGAIGLNHMCGAVHILPKNDQTIVVDAAAAARLIARSRRVICPPSGWMGRILHRVECGVLLT